MKTLPIVFEALSMKDKRNALLRETLEQNVRKMNKLIIVNLPKQKIDVSEFISKKENIDFSKIIKQINKEFFG